MGFGITILRSLFRLDAPTSSEEKYKDDTVCIAHADTPNGISALPMYPPVSSTAALPARKEQLPLAHIEVLPSAQKDAPMPRQRKEEPPAGKELPIFQHRDVPAPAIDDMSRPKEDELVLGSDTWKMHVPALHVDKKDADTPDNWVKRDPRILRLTGRHPLNCEPTMQDLMASGFITPPSIHYVRNHGAVPKLTWDAHRINIGGMVGKPCSLTMDELVKLPTVTIPVTLVCAGNRRKEENMLKKSIGFNWGPCAVSTSYWTGVRLSDLLLHVGAKTWEEGARYVCFKGPGKELPKGSDGSYGTSLHYAVASNPAHDVLIAYKQNHRLLTPDHGYPVRIIIPGHIGGRMVKWLSEITVEAAESDNHYHFHDNRVMPPHVDEALAIRDGWWYKPDYIINELNINSAVARPWHDEVINLLEGNKSYNINGYAYTGGGRKVTRVEVSLDDGKLWHMTNITRTEEPTQYNKHWCWVTWDFDVKVFDLMQCKEILVRAWDSSNNGQPALITWNLMGMMNNCYFRVKVLAHTDEQGNIGLRFQHPAPVEVGAVGNVGWREEEKLVRDGAEAAAAPPPPSTSQKAATEVLRGYTMAEVEQHNTEKSAWFVHEGRVYDATPFLEDHPGGAESILISTGMDATLEFNSIHSSKAKKMLADYYIGDLIQADATTATEIKTQVVEKEESLVVLDPKKKIPLPLVEKIVLSHDTRLFRFGLPSDQHVLGLPCGKHVFLYASVNGEMVMRAYTPTSAIDRKGNVDLVIKVYPATDSHPPGKMSTHMDSMAIGDTLLFKGPTGHFEYVGMGQYVNGKKSGVAQHLSMVAGGTGITPCWQVLNQVLRTAGDTTQVSLIFANRTEDDILLRPELDSLAAQHPRFKVTYLLSSPPKDWAHCKGRVSTALLKSCLFAPGPGSLALLCGPPGMVKAAEDSFTELGFPEDCQIVF